MKSVLLGIMVATATGAPAPASCPQLVTATDAARRAVALGFLSSRAWLETYPMTDVAQKAKLVKALRELGF